MKPSESCADEENVTNNGLLPDVGLAEILTEGATFAGVGVGVGVGAGATPSVDCRIVPSFLS
jgi:hypothetical protein